MNKLALAVFGVFFLSFNVNAQESYTLEKAKSMAVENSTAVKNSKLDVDIADRKVWETKAIGLPQISGEGNFQHFIDIPTQVIPANAFNPFAPSDQLVGVQFGTDYSVTGKVSVSQLIFDGRYLVGLQAIKMFKQVSDQSLEKSEQQAQDEAEEAYYMVVVAKEQVKVLAETMEKLEKLQNDIKILADEKVVEMTEVDQMSLNVARLQNNITLANKQLELAKDLLKLKMGLALTENIDAADSLAGFIDMFNVAEYTQKEYNSTASIDAQLLETQLALDKLEVKNQKAAYLPSLGAFFQTQQQAFRNEFDFFEDKPWYPANVWGINLNVPIFSSGQRMSKVKQAELKVMQTENNISAFNEGLTLQIKNAKVNLESSWDIFITNKQSVEVAQRILDNSQIKYKEGVISGSEFTQSENQFISTQSEYINAAYNVLKAKLELQKLISE